MQNDPSRPAILLPWRYCASTARAHLVRLMKHVAATGEPIEITRRGKQSVYLVRALDFESCLTGNHPWASIRERYATREGFRPNGIRPGVHFAWKYCSATRTRDRFCYALGVVDDGGQPLLVTRRGAIPLMLLARRVFVAYWRLGLRREASAETPGAATRGQSAGPRNRLSLADRAARKEAMLRRMRHTGEMRARRLLRMMKQTRPAAPTVSPSSPETPLSQSPQSQPQPQPPTAP